MKPSDPTWVSAAPFRAHLVHLLACTGLEWPVLALAADLPLAVADRLLHGRGGRALSRIDPLLAARLLAIRPTDLAGLSRQRVPAAPTARRLAALQAEGATLTDLAARWGVTAAGLAALPHQLRCSRLLALQVRSAHELRLERRADVA